MTEKHGQHGNSEQGSEKSGHGFHGMEADARTLKIVGWLTQESLLKGHFKMEE